MTRFRVRTTTETLTNGTKVERRKIVKAPELEWRLQAAAVRALRKMPEYRDEWGSSDSGPCFTLAGDMNAAKRSPQQAVKDKATGLTAGEPDLRLYISGGVLRSIEFKAEKGRLSTDQKDRHALLAGLGFDVVVLRASAESEAAERAVALVRGWLAANDDEPGQPVPAPIRKAA
jgi:hypothetical protein